MLNSEQERYVKLQKTLGYLSGAPRISTDPRTEITAGRRHVLGVIKGFEGADWVVKQFIAGDGLPKRLSQDGSYALVSKSLLHRLLADVVRCCLRKSNMRQAWNEVGKEVDWVYERFALLQAVGKPFRNRGIPWILETNALLYEEATNERKTSFSKTLTRWFERKAYMECDVVVCVTESLKKMIAEKLLIPAEKIVVMRNGVDTELFDPHAHSPMKREDGFLVGFVGSLAEWCRLDRLLMACSELRDEGYKIKLLIVGDGPSRREFMNLCQKLEISPHVQFTGRVGPDEVPSYISSVDVAYCNTVHGSLGSQTYASPMKLYEYMSMAKPVIAGEFEDTVSIIDDNKSGFLFKWDDPMGLKRALLAAYQNREDLPAMGRLAREEIVQNHSWACRVRTLIKEVERILERSS